MQAARLSLLLHESKAKSRTKVINDDNIQVQWDLSGFYHNIFNACNIVENKCLKQCLVI